MIIKKLQGVFSPVIVPFKDNGDIDYEMYSRNLEKWNEDMLSGFFALSSAGEAPFLTEDEKLKLVETTVRIADRNKLILVGAGSESTRTTISLTNKAAGAGADAAVVMTPAFYKNKMNDRALVDYFTEVAEAADIPVIIYNAPQFTNINISIEAVSLLSKVQNIIGIKEGSPDITRLAELKRHLPSNFNILAGLTSLWYPALTLGIEAGILGMANCAPNECSGIQEAYSKGNVQEAYDIFMRLLPVAYAIETRYGVPGMKFIADEIGYEGGKVRKPLQQLSGEEQTDLKHLMSAAQLFVE